MSWTFGQKPTRTPFAAAPTSAPPVSPPTTELGVAAATCVVLVPLNTSATPPAEQPTSASGKAAATINRAIRALIGVPPFVPSVAVDRERGLARAPLPA